MSRDESRTNTLICTWATYEKLWSVAIRSPSIDSLMPWVALTIASVIADAEDASHRGAAYLIYCDAFRRLQERCRADAATR